MNIPIDLKYTKDHEWVKIDGDTATIGITDFAQGELGDIVYVDVDTLDETVDKDDVFGSVEAVKTVSDLFMPLTGEVVEFNEGLEDDPEIVNKDPYVDGWIIKITITDQSQIVDLLDAQAYQGIIGGQCYIYSCFFYNLNNHWESCKIRSNSCRNSVNL